MRTTAAVESEVTGMCDGKTMMCAAALFAAVTGHAKHTEWNVSYGGLFSDPANWSNGAPANPQSNNDEVYVGYNGEEVVLTNDIENLKVYYFKTMSGGKVTVCGNGVSVNAGGGIYANSDLVLNVPVTLRSTASGSMKGANGVEVSVNDTVTLTNGASETSISVGGSGTVFGFNGRIDGALATLSSTGNTQLYFRGPVDVAKFHAGPYWSTAVVEFHAQNNGCKEYSVGSTSSLFFKTNNALNAEAVLRFDDETYLSVTEKTWSVGDYVFSGDQTIDRVVSGSTLNAAGEYQNINHLRGSGTITMRASRSDVSHAQWKEDLSMVYFPLGDYEYVMSNRTHTMTGGITVRGGTLKAAGSTSFPSVSSIEVESGTFELASTASGAFAACRKLTIGEGAVFRTGAEVSGSPFGSGMELKMEAGAKLDLGGNTSVVFEPQNILVDGTVPAARTYTGAGYGSDEAVECDWITGAGRVTVGGWTGWKGGQSGNWNDPANWTDGLPSAEIPAIVYSASGDLEISVTQAGALGKCLYLGCAGEGKVKLTGDFSLTNQWIVIGAKGKIEVPAGCTFFYTGLNADGGRTVDADDVCSDANSPIRISDGGELLVSGGTVTITNFAGYVLVDGGKIRATAGGVGYHALDAVNDCIMLRDGEMTFSGTSVFSPLSSDNVQTRICGSGEVTFADSAKADPRMDSYYGMTADYAITWNFFSSLGSLGGSVVFGSDASKRSDSVYNISNALIEAGLSGLQIIGSRNDYYYAAEDLRAEVNVFSGGMLNVKDGGAVNNIVYGLVIGNYVQGGDPASGTVAHGSLNVYDGGAVTNKAGHFIVGGGAGEGMLLIDGGTVRSYTGDDPASRQFVIGAWHGAGTCELKDGSLHVAHDAYIGGVVTNGLFDISGKYISRFYPLHDASGVFRQSGGRAKFDGCVVLGSDGTGVLEMCGKEGSFEADSMVLSNTVHNAASGAVLKFTLGASGVRPVTVEGGLVIGANAKLVVDATAYPEKGRSVTLVEAGSVTGAFGTIELDGGSNDRLSVVYTSRGIVLKNERGMSVIVR